MVLFVFSKSHRNFKKIKKICSGCRRSQRHEKLEAKLAGLKACFAYEQRNFYSNSVIINRLRRPKVNALQENFSSNHGLKRKFSILRTTLYFTLREIQIYPGNARKYFSHVGQVHSVCNSSCNQMSSYSKT